MFSFWVQEHLKEALEISLSLHSEEERIAVGDGNEVGVLLSSWLNLAGVG